MAYDSEHGKLWQDIKADLDKTRVRASKFANAAEWAFGRRTARVLGILMLFAVVVALLLVFLNWYIDPTKPGDKKDLVLAMAQILAGTALLSGLYFTWRTLQVNREGQITERFTRAIDQLGATNDDNSNNLELRLGGIYALERISKESEEDHGTIMEVLTAYVRQHSPWPPKEAQPVDEDAAVEKKSEADLRGKSETTEVPDLAADIQAIITIIRRRTRYFGYGETEALDLHETNLFRANLFRANLFRANLFRASLNKADLSRANLSGAYIEGANLAEASLYEADLSKARLANAKLANANLFRANLSGASLYEADLSGQESSLYEADLSGAYLLGANLTEAILVRANFSEAILSEADLSGAYLSGAILTQEQLEKTMSGDENTQLPPDLKPPAHWNVKTDEQIEGD